MEKIYNKLVRDNIPRFINTSGKKAKFQQLSKEAYKEALKAKLVEEVNEFVNAKNNSERIEEIADIKEVITAITKEFSLKNKDINNVRFKKNLRNGAFNKRYFLESVEE